MYIISGKSSMKSAIELSKKVKIDCIVYPEDFNKNFWLMENLLNTGIPLISTKDIDSRQINNLLLTIGYDNNYNIMDVVFNGKHNKVIISGNLNNSPDEDSINVFSYKKLMLYKYNNLPLNDSVLNSVDNNITVECFK